jgi:tRNA threonylcarbamoyladenosine biosynthesis protein TsaB
MIILGIRTDKPEAELYLYDGEKQLEALKWQAHRELSSTLHQQINKVLNKSSISMSDIGGVVCFQGPGSFTGLRIGLTVANALAYAQDIPIVAHRGEKWLESGIKDLSSGKNDRIVTPYYDRPATISTSKQ